MFAAEDSSTTTVIEVVVSSLPESGVDWVSVASILVSLLVGLVTVGVAFWAVRQANAANDAQLTLSARQQDFDRMNYGLQVELQDLQKRVLRLDEKQAEWNESDRLPWIQVTPRVEVTELKMSVPSTVRSDYVRLTNTGRTPAYNVMYSAEFANSEHPLTDFFLENGHGEFEVIGPGEFVDVPIRSPEDADLPYPMVRIVWRDSLDSEASRSNYRHISWF